jgi:hypothetical protein
MDGIEIPAPGGEEAFLEDGLGRVEPAVEDTEAVEDFLDTALEVPGGVELGALLGTDQHLHTALRHLDRAEHQVTPRRPTKPAPGA